MIRRQAECFVHRPTVRFGPPEVFKHSLDHHNTCYYTPFCLQHFATLRNVFTTLRKAVSTVFPRFFDFQDKGASTRAHRNRADRCFHRYQLLGVDFDVFDFQAFPGVRSVNAAIPCLNHARIRILPGRFGLQLSDALPNPPILRPCQRQRESKLIRV